MLAYSATRCPGAKPSKPVLRNPSHGHAARRSTVVTCAQTAHPATYAQLEAIKLDLEAFPQARYFNVTAVVRPWRLTDVVQALSAAGVRGLTVTDVSGVGFQGGKERYGGSEYGEGDLIDKKKVEVVCVREQVDVVVRSVAVSTFTGEVGDGKIWVSPVADVMRVRTGETGVSAERMMGGREEALQSK